MQLSGDAVKEFSTLYESEFGIALTSEEAREQLQNLVTLVAVLLLPEDYKVIVCTPDEVYT